MSSQKLHITYILPSRYDAEGYVQRWWRGVLPSNTLFCLKGLTESVISSGALGSDVSASLTVLDDTVQPIPIEKLCRQSRKRGETLLVGLVGVQSNQMARAVDRD